jgi:hypothetical protein
METTQHAEKLLCGFDNQVRNWSDATKMREYASASAIAIHALRRCLAQEKKSSCADERVICSRGRVLFNGLRDYANLMQITAVSFWLENTNAVELVWDLLHDARDRIDACTDFLADDFSSAILAELGNVENSINERFGTGFYSSPEVTYGRLLCTICEKDVRGCTHEPGRYYDGRYCQVYPVDPNPHCVAMVEKPADPRCRIWPWLPREEDGDHIVLRGVPILISFSLFGGEGPGERIDLGEIFQRKSTKHKNSNAWIRSRGGRRARRR